MTMICVVLISISLALIIWIFFIKYSGRELDIGQTEQTKELEDQAVQKLNDVSKSAVDAFIADSVIETKLDEILNLLKSETKITKINEPDIAHEN